MQRHYLEGEGDFDFEQQQYSFKVSYLELPEPDQSLPVPSQRVITEVAPDLNSPHDIVVPVLMGWGETSAQMEGSMLKCLLRSLKKKGYTNPKVIGVNCVGKGTPAYSYADNQNEIGVDDELNDARALAKHLYANGHLGDNVCLVGHSMGNLAACAFWEQLNGAEEVESERATTNVKVNRLLAMMPATDQRLGLIRPGFLLAVRNQVLPAIYRVFIDYTGLDLSYKDFKRIMFEGSLVDQHADWVRTVPDSARRFLEATFTWNRKFGDLFKEAASDKDLEVHIFGGGNDTLIPRSMLKDYQSYLGDQGITADITYGEKFSHSIPFDMTLAQEDEMDKFLDKALPTKQPE